MKAGRSDGETENNPAGGGDNFGVLEATPEKIYASAMGGTTHWTVVLEAGDDGAPQAAAALEQLCRTYWYPLYAYIRTRGHGIEEAEDLTQGFFLRLFENHRLARVDPGKGKFRSFLLSALNHFLANEWRRSRAAKRGGGQPPISLDSNLAESRYLLEPASSLTPEVIFERRWAMTLLDNALNRLRAECAGAGKADQFEKLKEFLTAGPEESQYGPAAAELGMTNGAVAVATHRLRQRYRELLREEIAHTVASPAEVGDEIRWLCAAIGQA